MIPKFINNKEKQLVLFDMDGVLAEFVAGEDKHIKNNVPNIYLDKRPIKSVIQVAEKLSKMKNVEVGILSSCDYSNQVAEKKQWLKKYLPFLQNNKIFILVWENQRYTKENRCFAKLSVIQDIKGYDKIYLIEDKHENILATNTVVEGCAHHISELLD